MLRGSAVRHFWRDLLIKWKAVFKIRMTDEAEIGEEVRANLQFLCNKLAQFDRKVSVLSLYRWER